MIDYSGNPFLELAGIRHALDMAGLRSVEMLAEMSVIDVLRIDGIRRGDLKRIEAFLAKRGLFLKEREDRLVDSMPLYGRRSTDSPSARSKAGR